MARTNAKLDMKKEAAAASAGAETIPQVTEKTLIDVCPPSVINKFKAAKTPALRADLLYALTNGELKKRRAALSEMEDFTKSLKAWFIQEFKDDQKGVTGKLGRVEVKRRDEPAITDVEKFCAYVWKKKEFDLLAIKKGSVKDRWEQDSEVPGVSHVSVETISLTGVKGK
jgi:hypothetical protein